VTGAGRTAEVGVRDLAVALVMNLLWGLNIVAVKMAVEATSPSVASLLRMTIVFAICAPALRLVPGRMGTILLLGLANGALFMILTNLSLAVSSNVSALAIAGQLGVPFSLLLAVLFLGERIHWPRILGMALAFGGVVLLVFDPAAARELPGLALAALASLVFAVGSLLQRRLAGVPVLTLYAWIGLVGTLVIAPLAWLLEPASLAAVPDLRLGGLGWIAFSAIGSTLLGHGGMAWLLQRHPLTTVAPLTLGSPVVAVLASSAFFKTPLTPVMIAGGVVTLAGVAVITVRSSAKARPR
jgi:O-acetylserine/cysteine efflux transporter